MISLKQCLEVMHRGATFGFVAVSYDKQRQDRCGRLIEYQEAVLVWGDKTDRADTPTAAAPNSERQPTPLERSMMPAQDVIEQGRKPNHAQHYTRNVRILMNGQPTEAIVKIHPALIIQFNGQVTTP
jgi:hypothetical protein